MITQKELDDAGVKRLDLARVLEWPYSTLSAKMAGFATMTEKDEADIRAAIESMKSVK